MVVIRITVMYFGARSMEILLKKLGHFSIYRTSYEGAPVKGESAISPSSDFWIIGEGIRKSIFHYCIFWNAIIHDLFYRFHPTGVFE